MLNRRVVIAAGAGALAATVWISWLAASGQEHQNLVKRRLAPQELAGEADTLIVDIRTPSEWRETGVIQGALLVTWTDADDFLAAISSHLIPGQTIALICRSDNRTGRAARQLAPKTAREIVDVEGGMLALIAEGHPMVRPAGIR